MGYVLVGYVLNGYVWDMCGVRYANNLLKNPATKRLSGKNVVTSHLSCRVHLCCDVLSCFVLPNALKEIHLIPSRPPSSKC